jgi:hypothetical protein
MSVMVGLPKLGMSLPQIVGPTNDVLDSPLGRRTQTRSSSSWQFTPRHSKLNPTFQAAPSRMGLLALLKLIHLMTD